MPMWPTPMFKNWRTQRHPFRVPSLAKNQVSFQVYYQVHSPAKHWSSPSPRQWVPSKNRKQLICFQILFRTFRRSVWRRLTSLRYQLNPSLPLLDQAMSPHSLFSHRHGPARARRLLSSRANLRLSSQLRVNSHHPILPRSRRFPRNRACNPLAAPHYSLRSHRPRAKVPRRLPQGNRPKVSNQVHPRRICRLIPAALFVKSVRMTYPWHSPNWTTQ